MKTRISMAMRSLWIVALLFVAQNANAQSFEGRIVQAVSLAQLGGEKMEMVMNLKGEKMMINMDMGTMGAMKMYTQDGGKSMVMVMEQMKMGYEFSMEDKKPEKTVSATPSAMKATGKKETINGYAAEEWTADLEDGMTMTLWLTNDIDKALAKAMQTAMKAQNAQNPNGAQSAVFRELTEKGLVAVRSTIAKDGETMATIDLVKIEKTSITDATFELPKDITIQKIDPSMMGQ